MPKGSKKLICSKCGRATTVAAATKRESYACPSCKEVGLRVHDPNEITGVGEVWRGEGGEDDAA